MPTERSASPAALQPPCSLPSTASWHGENSRLGGPISSPSVAFKPGDCPGGGGPVMTQQLIKPQSRLLQVGGTAGMVGPALFAVVFILQNVVRTDDDAIAEPVSALSIGEYGWVQRLNFVVLGVLLLVFAAALHRGLASSRLGWVGPTLLSVAGVGLFVAATFSLARDETGAIYDPSVHQVAGTMFFGGTALGLIALSRRLTRDPQ